MRLGLNRASKTDGLQSEDWGYGTESINVQMISVEEILNFRRCNVVFLPSMHCVREGSCICTQVIDTSQKLPLALIGCVELGEVDSCQSN